MSTFCLIYDITNKKFSDFKSVHIYISHYQVIFNEVIDLLMDTSSYICKNTEIYIQVIMLINIEMEYSTFISAIQKNWKDNTTNLIEVVLQIIRYFEFIKKNKKSQKVLQTNNILQTFILLINRAFKSSCTNPKYVKKGLTTHYTNYCQIKYSEL